MNRRTLKPVVVYGLCFVSLACSMEPESASAFRETIIYGADDRRDYFEVDSLEWRALVASSMVALVPNQFIENGQLKRTRKLGELNNLCPGEAFIEQPNVAFCSGVLVDWDLVLSAGHCARALPVQQFSAVFDFYYSDAGKIAANSDSIFKVEKIVAERLDPPDSSPHLDYAWFRLARPARGPRQPVPIYNEPHSLQGGDTILSIGANAGLPMKVDSGGIVLDARLQMGDYFLVSADNFGGSSGGAAFDDALVLSGILGRGEVDWVTSPSGCREAVRLDQIPPGVGEQYTYTSHAVEGLCTVDQSASVCRIDCGNPCRALPPVYFAAGGCALAGGRGTSIWDCLGLSVLCLGALRRKWARTASSSAARAAEPLKACRCR